MAPGGVAEQDDFHYVNTSLGLLALLTLKAPPHAMSQVGRRTIGSAETVFRLGCSLCRQFGAEFADFTIQFQDLLALQGLPVGFKLRGPQSTGFVILIPITRLL
ncbi:hypothetical protein D3C79_717640 [compost metagenome]